MLRGSQSIWAVILLLAPLVVSAQDQGQVFNVTRVFNLAGTVYNQGGSLLPQHFNLYNIPVPSNYTDPDILLTLNSTTGGTALALYCNPQYGSFASASSSYPGPGYAVWSSELTTMTNQIFISKNDDYYKSPTANSSTPLAFLCSVINSDVNTTTNYTLTANIVSSNRTLVSSEQTMLGNLYAQCCSATGACSFWKTQNSGSSNANGGTVKTDFCSFPDQVCSPTGNLYRLNLAGYNLTCQWPGSILSSFPQLSSLVMGTNVNLQGNISSVAQTVANLTTLQILDLTGNTGLTGFIENGTTSDNICKSARASIVSMSLNGMGLTGAIPSCLYSNSSLISLDLGYNNFTGTIANTIPTNSPLQYLHLQNNNLTGKMPATLSNANYLADLNTSTNMMTGSLPASVGGIKTLQSFVIAVNNHTGAIPDTFGTAANLKVFDVKLNNFTALPAAWTNASYNAANSSFANIRASFNSISGSFPTGLINAQQLMYLILNENKMTGPLPSNTSMFPSLRALNISANRFNGSLPSQWSQTAIFSTTPVYLSTGQPLQQVFDVSSNQFSGALPSFLSKASVPSWTQNGIFLQGNSFNASCSDNNYNYITSLCPQGNATTQNSQVPAVAPSTAPTTSQASPPASQGAVAGIVIGVLAALAVGLFLAFLAIRRKRKEPMMPRDRGSTFAMPNFGDGEFGRKSSLKKGLTSLSSNPSGFERFTDEQGFVELSQNGHQNGHK